VNFTDSLSYEC